jgi:resuscitation-promoting factor RpfB
LLRSIKYGLGSAAVAGLVAGTVAFTAGPGDKTVHLVVDGRPQSVTTTATDVRGALADAGFHPGSHDLLAPAASSALKNGETVVYKRGRRVLLTVDGRQRTVWTTAPTVNAALDALGYSPASFTSVSRSKRLPLGVTDIALRTPKQVEVVHDGRHTTVSSTATDVSALLDDLNLHLGPYDRLSVKRSTPLADGLTVKLTRVRHRAVFRTQAVPYQVRSINDSTMPSGRTKVVTAGRSGLMRVSYAIVYVDGKRVGKTHLTREVVRKPRAEVKRVGTKRVVPEYTGTPNSAQAIARSMMAREYGWGADQFSCVVQMWNNESGWRTNAYNPSGAYGIPQALPGSKMATAGPDWQTDATTQIKWGLQYIASRYGTPCGAWGFWQAHNYY